MVDIHIKHFNNTWEDYFSIKDYKLLDDKLAFLTNPETVAEIVVIDISKIDRILIVNKDK